MNADGDAGSRPRHAPSVIAWQAAAARVAEAEHGGPGLAAVRRQASA
jgi:hypothetical protein